MDNVATINLPQVPFANIDDILVNGNGDAGRITKANFLGAMNDWSTITNKPFEDFEQKYFRTTERTDGADILILSDSVITSLNKVSTLETEITELDTKVDNNYTTLDNSIVSVAQGLSALTNSTSQSTNALIERIEPLETNSHTHSNKSIIDLFNTNTDGKLVWNDTIVGSDYELPVASTSTLGGIKVDGTTITADSDGTIHGVSQGIDFTTLTTIMTTGTQTGITVTADNDNERFNFEVTGIPAIAIDSEGYWTVDGERGENPTKAQGEKGDKGTDGTNGTDGISPHIDEVTSHWFIGETDTGVNATANIDDTSTTETDVSWSAKKLNDTIGDINTILASVTGGVT